MYNNIMKILKPTLTKIILFIIIIAGAYYYNSNRYFVRYNCQPGSEVICAENAKKENQKIALTMTIITGLPIAIIGYGLIGLIDLRRKMTGPKTEVS